MVNRIRRRLQNRLRSITPTSTDQRALWDAYDALALELRDLNATTTNGYRAAIDSIRAELDHGLERTESWPDKETGEKRTKDVVVVDSRFGEVGVSLKYVSARIERAPHAAQAS